MKFDRIRAGMTLYMVSKQKAGNTTLSSVVVWPVRIVSVDSVKGTAIVSRNGNREQTFGERQLAKLRATQPLLIRGGFGIARLATREEIAAHKAATSGVTR